MLASPLNAALGISAEDLDDGRVRLSMEVGPQWINEVGLVHGGLMALLIDGAAGRALARTLGPGESAGTVHLSIQYLRPAPAGALLAEARIVKRGKRIAFLEGECRAAEGDVIARATATFSVHSK
jgi:uncharacterized protein (TIGR00369 family)